MSHFLFKREGNRILVKLNDDADHWELLCEIVKHDRTSWTEYVLEHLNTAEALMRSGLTREEVQGIARLYKATREEAPNE